MDSRIAVCRRPNVVARQAGERSAHWFYIVDLDAAAGEGQHTLSDGSVVLGVSATDADAIAAAALDGLGVVYYTELGDAERRRMKAQIDDLRRGTGRE
jgi:hypothetical protein